MRRSASPSYLDIFCQTANRVKGGVSRRSEPLMRFAVWLMGSREGEARGPASVQASKRRWRPIVQGAMRALLVIVIAPLRQLCRGVLQRSKPFHVQAFIAQKSVEAFDIAVLHRAAWADEA